MLCEYFNCNNEFILFHAILEKFYLIHKTGDCLMHYDCSCTRLTWIHGVSRLAPSVTVAWRLYFYCKIHRVDLTLYNNYLLIHTLRWKQKGIVCTASIILLSLGVRADYLSFIKNTSRRLKRVKISSEALSYQIQLWGWLCFQQEIGPMASKSSFQAGSHHTVSLWWNHWVGRGRDYKVESMNSLYSCRKGLSSCLPSRT